jgi:hypothetical protein
MSEEFGNSTEKSNSEKSTALEKREVVAERTQTSLVEQARGLLSDDSPADMQAVKPNQLSAALSNFFKAELPSRREMDSILAYVKESPTKIRERAEEIEQLCSRLIDSEQQPNLAGMLLISEIEHAQGAVLLDNKLTLSLYRKFRPDNVQKLIEELYEKNDPEGNVVLHRLLDFCQQFWSSLQNIVPDDAEYWDIKEIDADWEGRPTFTQEMVPLLREGMDKAENYLLKKHFVDALETVELWGDKEGGMSGSPGGMSDATIFSHRALGPSIDLRRRMNMWSGYPIAQELVPIAQGYVGLYTHGELQNVFPEVFSTDNDEISREDQELISLNDNESYDWIYDSLNRPELDEADSSTGLEKLRSLWNLDEDLKQSGDSFYFDLGRINLEGLHPTVRSDILARNFFILQNLHGSQREPRPLSEEEFQRKLFPAGSGTSSQEYMYKYLSNFSMREKVQAEFGISIAELSFAEQMHFLEYLNSRPEQEFNEAKQFSKELGTDALHTFLVVGDDPILREQVYKFSRTAPLDDVRKVLKTYGSLVSVIDDLDTYLANNFGAQNHAATADVTSKIIDRSKRFLAESVSSDTHDLGSITENLERMKSDALVFAAAFRTLRERGELSDIGTLRGVSLVTERASKFAESMAEVKKIEQLIEEAYRASPASFRKKVLDSFHTALVNPNTRFYVLKRNDEPIAALRFDDIKDAEGRIKERYFGSFVSDSAYGNGKLGEAIFEKAIDAETKEGTPINAHCNPFSAITQKYIEAGFVATGLEDYAGVPSFSIRLEAKINGRSETKAWKAEQIIQAALSQNTETIQAFSVQRPEEIPFNLVNEGFVLTRYLKQGERLYAVFERLSVEPDSADDAEKGIA